EAMDGLKLSTMFTDLSEQNLRRVACRMTRQVHPKGEVLMRQGEPQRYMHIVTHGTVTRVRFENGRLHSTEKLGTCTSSSRNTIGALHLLYEQPTYATARCTTDVVAYRLSSEDLDELLESSQSISKQMVFALSNEIKRQSALRTPLLDQKAMLFPIVPTSIAAATESFYRSALNSWLNYRLTGQSAALFPNMHIQLPTRILYINGFK
ncbi:cyclic nucleotide-binding-like protein, partial [Pavlovales sp. CCMP2436]